MKKILLFALLAGNLALHAQTNPAITSWLQNNTIYGSYYKASSGSTPIKMSVLANCQEISYSSNWVYVKTGGIPTYPTGVFTGDGNTNLAGDQKAIYKFPLNPTENTGTPTVTSLSNNGVFINGVSLFDWQDGVKYLSTAVNGICGGPPGNPTCPMGYKAAWSRDAVPAEKKGFDCAKGHPAGTNYHHHQNPSAFKHDGKTSASWSNICDTYDSDGLYTLDPTKHSPLIGFAYDGFPIYGAYGYTNTDGTGGISRMKSSYKLKNHTTRTNGPSIGQTIGTQTFFNGYFKEDYEYVAQSNDPTYLDEHNGRFCITPEYPKGIYCYFATINADNSSAYPYIIGPTYHGTRVASKVTSITEPVTVYKPTINVSETNNNGPSLNIFPNPASDFVAVQIMGLNRENLKIEMFDVLGKLVLTSTLNAGASIAYLDITTVYSGNYIVKVSGENSSTTHKVVVEK